MVCVRKRVYPDTILGPQREYVNTIQKHQRLGLNPSCCSSEPATLQPVARYCLLHYGVMVLGPKELIQKDRLHNRQLMRKEG